MSDFIDRHWKEIRFGLHSCLGLLVAHQLYQFGFVFRFTKIPSHLFLMHWRLYGQFFIKDSQLYFRHEPLLMRLLLGRRWNTQQARSIKIPHIQMNDQVVEHLNTLLPRYGKLKLIQDGPQLVGLPRISYRVFGLNLQKDLIKRRLSPILEREYAPKSLLRLEKKWNFKIH